MEDTRIAESCIRIRIRGYGDEVRTGTEIDFTEEVCGQINDEICRAALSESENSGFRKTPAEEKIIERTVESYGPEGHYAMEKDSVLSPESGELSDEQSDDDYLSEHISDTGFWEAEDFVDNDARSETSFAGCLKAVACDNVTAIARNFGGGVKANSNHMLGADGLMELKTGGLGQKLCNATHVADETQMCTAEYTVDTLDNWTSSGGIDRLVV